MTTAKRHQEGNPYQLIKALERRLKTLETSPNGLSSFAMQPNLAVFALITSGVFSDVFNCGIHVCVADAVHIAFPWATDAGTTGQVQLYNNVIGGSSASVVNLPAASSGIIAYNWLHGQPLGTRNFQPTIKALRSGGAGNVTLWVPGTCYMAVGDVIGATAVGV